MPDRVQDQYEAYPYPARNPRDEHKRLITGSPSHLAEVAHYLFGGRIKGDASGGDRPFRALVAGGGTGDAAIMLAQQLADRGRTADVVYLDLSTASRAIAESRARERGLTNISFRNGSLVDLPDMDLGLFDYIDCCGVLHHLADPRAGLRALARVLTEDGGMGIMLYAPYGRSGVYPMQDMLRTLGAALPLAQRVAQARRLLEALPASNWLRRNPFLGDHKRSDAELVDLLLHSQDRAFSVEEVADLVGSAGLTLAAFVEPARYEPATYLSDPRLLAPLQGLDLAARAAFAEKLAGNIKTHVFYVSRRDGTVAQPDPEGCAVPVLRSLEAAALAKSLRSDPVLKLTLDGLPLRFRLPRLAPAILERVDGTTSITEICAALNALDPRLDGATFEQQFAEVYRVLSGFNHLLLRFD